MERTKTFRVFISSTFNDLTEERNLLQTEVFPDIKAYCESKGYRFQVIDLRWGVSNEAGLDHKAIKICINEVKRSLEHPKPNFIALLGDRYGWVSLPTEIETSLFETLVSQIESKSDQDFLYTWYKLDTNLVPSQYILQPVYEVYSSNEAGVLADRWQEDEQRLLKLIQNAASQRESLSCESFFTSATEQEINSGVLEISEPNNVLVLDREIKNLKEIKNKVLLEQYYDSKGEKRLVGLKKKLREKKEVKYKVFKTELIYSEITTNLKIKQNFFDSYIFETKQFLKENIDLEIARINSLEDNTVELTHHEVFMKEKSSTFVGRGDIVKEVLKYVKNGDSSPYIIFGESGVGKSALMATLAMELQVYQPLYRFIGITEKSSVPIMFLNDLIYILEDKLEIKHTMQHKSNEYDSVVSRFLELLSMFKEKEKLVILIDAVDQFTEFTKLEWIEDKLPDNVKIIVSTLPGAYLDILTGKIKPKTIKEIKPLSINDGEEILKKWLDDNSRKLQDEQFSQIIKKFNNNGLPLYLKIAFEESLHWHSYSPEIELSETLVGIIHGYISRLIAREYHPKELVEHVLGYISASKNGLSEDELYEILSQDKIVMQAISNPHHQIKTVDNIPKLPAVIWARFYADLVKHLSFTTKDDSSLLNFYHRKISETVRDYYYEPDHYLYHVKLAEYFLTKSSKYSDGKGEQYNLRKNSELPYQLYKSESYKLFVDYYDLEVLQVKSERKHITQALLELHNVYTSLELSTVKEDVKEKLKYRLCEILLAYLLTKVKQTDSPLLSVEAMHANYVYRNNKSYYEHLLEIASNLDTLRNIYLHYQNKDNIDEKNILRYFIAFKARYSNKIRREAKLSDAFKNYEELIETFKDSKLNNKADFDELSKIEYDMGYILYLQNKFDESIHYLDDSIVSCEKAEKPINAVISRCIKYRVGFLSGKYSGEEFHEILDRAYELFYANRLKNSSAKRWVRNVVAHQFEIAYSNKDRDETKRLFALLENDEWKLEYENENKFTSDLANHARILILEGHFSEAVREFEIYLTDYIGDLDTRKRRESVGRDYYDYLIALKSVGEMKKFKMVMQEFQESIPDEPGNLLWKMKAKQIKKE